VSKINNVRLPNAATQGYSAEQFNQLVRSLEQVILQLNTTYVPTVSESRATALSWFSGGNAAGGGFAGGIRGFQLSNGILLPNAMLVSDADQTNASVTGENLVTYTINSSLTGIRIVDNSKIYVPCGGNYLVSFSLQVTNRSNSAGVFEVWAKDTGVNFASSNTRYDIPARKSATDWSHIVPAVTGIFTVNDPSTNFLQLAWWSDNLDVYLEHYAVGVSPARPAIPSVILTISFISGV
jgi:hypothetical protein